MTKTILLTQEIVNSLCENANQEHYLPFSQPSYCNHGCDSRKTASGEFETDDDFNEHLLEIILSKFFLDDLEEAIQTYLPGLDLTHLDNNV